ncbi:hypothetical protein [Gloeothece verrucosa]|uniref:Uncharacterized protein n=1 Tax=Gloeothece verrucosa (strain PCC 7822) TaxID=497965 RepID=E0U5K5_GLOV7|nr:hypothetical protein [Gloeothece verrucosa]ADN14718.1 conserved hypothetical protein [Gloeothece verrucosa PCC 7822]
MKLQPRSLFSIGLTLLLTGTFFIANVLNLWSQQPAFAQELVSSCPLSQDIAITFLNAECQAIQLTEPKVYYRYYNNDGSYKYGRYLTTDRYGTNTDVITKLALNQNWGNKARMMETVTVPAGTIIYQGIVGPQDPPLCYPGGGQQTFITDSKDPNIQWSEGMPMIVNEFQCP